MNHGPNDARGNPSFSDGLAECLSHGAALFGWDNRNRVPRSQRDGDWVGHGMAAAHSGATTAPSAHLATRGHR